MSTEHRNTLIYTTNDDGVWIECSCGELIELGFCSSLGDALGKWRDHVKPPRLRPPDETPRVWRDVTTDLELPDHLQNLADHTKPGEHVGEFLAQAARRIKKLESELAAAKRVATGPSRSEL